MNDHKISFSIQWHITSLCPNRCKHCYMFSSDYDQLVKQELNLEQLLFIYNRILEFEKTYPVNIDHITITGGDPLIRKDYPEILNRIHESGKTISILGVPESVNPSTISCLENLGVIQYQLSLDGTKETHDSIRGKGSFDRTIAAIKMLSESKISVQVMYTVHRANFIDMPEVIRMLDSLNCKVSFTYDFLVYTGNGISMKSDAFSKDEVKKILEQYLNIADEMSLKDSKLRMCFKPSMYNAIFRSNQRTDCLFGIRGCTAGQSQISILSNGDVYPCRRLPIIVGNLLDESIGQIFLNNTFMKKLRRRQNFTGCGSCKYYDYCRGCPAVTYSITGNAFDPFPYCYLYEPDDSGANLKPDFPLQCSVQEEMNYIVDSKRELATKDLYGLYYILNHEYLFGKHIDN